MYFKAIDSYSKTAEISNAARDLLKRLVEEENLSLEKFIPIKVHFGEKGNNTFIKSENFNGVINYLKEKNIDSAFIETNVLYRGERTTKEKHVKQLGMGCAARGGKLAQHAYSIPKVSILKCKACNACAKKCPQNAISVNKRAKIDKDKCIGCASCMAICPHGAISNSWLASISKAFNERLSEYAYAAAKDKNNIYITYAFNITRNCDCEGHNMKPMVKDVGVFASIDPVAIDKACLDIIDRNNGKTVFKRGRYTLDYAEKIGLGSKQYGLIELI